MAGVNTFDWRRRKSVDREVRTETREHLPSELRMIIDQIVATVKGHESRLVEVESFRDGLIREAAAKMKGAA